MKTKLLPLALGILAIAVPSWADAPSLPRTPAEDSIATASDQPVYQSSLSPEELMTEDPTGTVSDAIPMLSLQLKRFDMGFDLLVQQIPVGPASVDTGVGVMITFKSS